jgi:hypothetical protein
LDFEAVFDEDRREREWPFEERDLDEDRLLDELRFFDRDFLLLSGMATPARRAFDSPIAIACLRFFTGCLPRFLCSISSRTYSPAWVVAAFPSRLSFAARRFVVFQGIGASK